MANELNQRSVAMAAAVATDGVPNYTVAIPLFRNTDCVKVDGKKIDLAPLSASLSKPGYLVGAKTCEFTPGLNLQGVETLTATPTLWRLDSIFRACGWARTTPGVGSLRLRMRSSGFETARVLFSEVTEDGNAVKWDIPGTIGNLEISGTAGAEIQVSPTLKGVYVEPTTAAVAGTITTGNNTAEYMQNAPLTLTVQGGTPMTTVIAKSFKVNAGYEINDWTDFGSAEGIASQRRSDRKPTHEIVVGMDYTKYIELLQAWSGGYSKRITAAFRQGVTVGARISFTLIGQLTNMPRGGEINLRTITLSFDGVPSSGATDDEYTIDLT